MQKLSELFGKICSASERGKKGVLVDLQTISEIRDEFWAMKHRAEAAEAESARLTRNYKHIIEQHMPRSSDGCDKGWTRVIEARELQAKLEAAEAKLAELAKQEPVAIVARQDPVLLWEWTKLGKRSDTPDGMYLYARPAPAADLAALVPVTIPKNVFNVIYDECGGFVETTANAQHIWEYCRAAILHNIEEKSK
ncbi:hypothetical protein [Pantoea sp.]|uniref:hypothetical protein n=1 Tax=Pantoea sp. TaxID=69393 RepID=UPI002905F7F6|nr:hypothetical protein [Pantoea sp.]MDU4128676.1 hypothetical protein [Pantoea sp.]